ncbi:hypothetical protein HN695_04430 [Candidatus Woesearchaeota archaeon]|jgi:hypothetical protein|nr:hypothetical protein [Candidatus Woesearchaeota archaeon]MBT5272397.1 hypothetical protein [Candidatus Woesearchaeota archaeon]MBT6041268.1 hypothetical protein [Candidatus Woesearchaeota archaeon]MBT6336669.1 hypothetical protein [Candidatus Woesearchaeota archaeon]MBT7927559.1 hypothetical protein [Candidatus Woesearchaeota archaeon]
MKKCKQCKTELVGTGPVHICPKCYEIEIEDKKWKGHKSNCPKCDSEVKLFQTHNKGRVYHCQNCNTIGHVLNDKEFHKKTYKVPKNSKLGKKLTWLFDVPCQYWFRKDEIEKDICKKCDMKKVCDEHSQALHKFTSRKDVEIYFAGDFIEMVHK